MDKRCMTRTYAAGVTLAIVRGGAAIVAATPGSSSAARLRLLPQPRHSTITPLLSRLVAVSAATMPARARPSCTEV